jgi:hypothetical protein
VHDRVVIHPFDDGEAILAALGTVEIDTHTECLEAASAPTVKPPAQLPKSERREEYQLQPNIFKNPRRLAKIDDCQKATDRGAQGGE